MHVEKQWTEPEPEDSKMAAENDPFPKPEVRNVNLYEKWKEYYDLAELLRSRSKQWINDGTLPRAKTSPEHETLKFFVIRAHTTFTAGVRLCVEGFAVASVILTRNLVEELITLRYILSTPGATERYADYAAVIDKRTLDKVMQLDETFAASLKNKWRKEEQRIMTEYEGIRQKYGADFAPRRWAGKQKDLKQLAADTDSSDLYNYFYGVSSDITHGSVRTDRYFMRYENDALIFYPGATEFLQPDGVKMLYTVFPLFWDEVSILGEKPSWAELKQLSSNEHFEHFSRNPQK